MKKLLAFAVSIWMLVALSAIPTQAVLSSATSRLTYTVTAGQTVFPYTFKTLLTSDLKVYVDSSPKALTTDYSVSGAGMVAGGNVTFVTAPATGSTVLIYREVPLTQLTLLTEHGPLPAKGLESTFDKSVMMSQQLKEAVDRSIKLPVTSPMTGVNLPVPGAGKLWGWNAAGTGAALYDLTGVAVNDGVEFVDSSQFADFASAIASLSSGTTLRISTVEPVAGDVTVPSYVTLWFNRSGSLAIATGKTVTVNGGFEAGNHQVISGAGVVRFAAGSPNRISAAWFGLSSSLADVVPVIKAAVASLIAGQELYLPAGDYTALLDVAGDTIDLTTDYVTISGEAHITLSHTAAALGIPLFHVTGDYVTIKDFTIEGSGDVKIDVNAGGLIEVGNLTGAHEGHYATIENMTLLMQEFAGIIVNRTFSPTIRNNRIVGKELTDVDHPEYPAPVTLWGGYSYIGVMLNSCRAPVVEGNYIENCTNAIGGGSNGSATAILDPIDGTTANSLRRVNIQKNYGIAFKDKGVYLYSGVGGVIKGNVFVAHSDHANSISEGMYGIKVTGSNWNISHNEITAHGGVDLAGCNNTVVEANIIKITSNYDGALYKRGILMTEGTVPVDQYNNIVSGNIITGSFAWDVTVTSIGIDVMSATATKWYRRIKIINNSVSGNFATGIVNELPASLTLPDDIREVDIIGNSVSLVNGATAALGSSGITCNRLYDSRVVGNKIDNVYRGIRVAGNYNVIFAENDISYVGDVPFVFATSGGVNPINNIFRHNLVSSDGLADLYSGVIYNNVIIPNLNLLEVVANATIYPTSAAVIWVNADNLTVTLRTTTGCWPLGHIITIITNAGITGTTINGFGGYTSSPGASTVTRLMCVGTSTWVAI